MKVRVITATRGDSPFFGETAASVLAAAPAADHVVICPSSRFPTAKKNQPIRFFAEDKPGLYAALNQGCRPAGDWDASTALNDDDLLLAPGFGCAVQELERHAEIDVVYGRVRLIDSRGKILGAQPVARRAGDIEALLVRGIMPLAQPGMVVRRNLIERLGGFDETYQLAGDLDFFVRALLSGAKFLFVNAWVASFRLHAGQLSKRRAELEAEIERAVRPLAGRPGRLAAWWRFRRDNLGVYFDRVRRHGWMSMRELYDRTE